MASVITTTPREPHGFFRPKALVAGLIVLALLAVLCVSLLWEATVPGPTAATAPQSSPAAPRPALAPAEEAYAQALWAIHADVKRAAYDLTFSGLRHKLKQADGPDFGTRVREASRTLDRAESRVRALAPPPSLSLFTRPTAPTPRVPSSSKYRRRSASWSSEATPTRRGKVFATG